MLSAPAGTEVLVLEMAMRGRGRSPSSPQIAEPDVGVIVNVGPVHLELLGSIEAIAAAKAELIAGLRPGGTAVVPADEPLLSTHLETLPDDVETVTFGAGGDVTSCRKAWRFRSVGTSQRPHAVNALAALAAARAIGVEPSGRSRSR